MLTSTREVYLPPEIIFEILSWLPVDSLLRFKCVCKQWCSIIKHSKFIDEHLSRAAGNWLYQTENGNPSAYPGEQQYLACCNGLVLEKGKLTQKYRLRNPATRQILDLPDPGDNLLYYCCHMTMCYVPSTSELKLVCPYLHEENGNAGCMILTVGVDITWRTLDFPLSCKLRYFGGKTQLTEEVYFILRLPHSVRSRNPQVVCMELGNENLSIVKIPHTFFLDWTNVRPMNWEEKLALASVIKEELHVWVLENHREQKWAQSKIVVPLTFMKNNAARQNIIPCRFSDHGLWVISVHGELLLMDVISRTIEYCEGAPAGQRFLTYNEPSLVHVKGMQSENETKHEPNYKSQTGQ